MKYILTTIIIICLSGIKTYSQVKLNMPRNIKEAYEQGTRNKTGKPGINYWQNKCSYNIAVNFDPNSRLIEGKADIVYINNSPDTLNNIVFKLIPNLFKSGTMRDVTIDDDDIGEGMVIEQIKVNGQLLDNESMMIEGTNMIISDIDLNPGGQVNFSIDYNYILNLNHPLRTGMIDDGAFFIAYFFPRIAVYDDIDGWDLYPHTGTYQFYNDFSDFNVAITVPDKYVVWATGDLINCDEVLSGKICANIQEAEKNDENINIIDSINLKNSNITSGNITNTFKFEAKNITDFSFATSNHYIWESTSVEVDTVSNRRVRVDAVYNPMHLDYFRVLGDAKKTVESMSFYYPKWPFPFGHISVFDGLARMEYPMMVNDLPMKDSVMTIQVTIHEIFHSMFPFYTGLNETKYGWMDEGLTTSGHWIVYEHLYPGTNLNWSVDWYEKMAGTEIDVPIMTLTPLLEGNEDNEENSYQINSYPKPALGILYIRDLLGDELFLTSLHNFIKNWRGKHPIPWDFFNSINQGSNTNLNWFWKAWFFDDGYPDLSVKSFNKKENLNQVIIESIGSKPVPIELVISYEDGSTEVIKRNVGVWRNGNRVHIIKIKSDKEVIKLELIGSHVPDVNRSNNIWVR